MRIKMTIKKRPAATVAFPKIKTDLLDRLSDRADQLTAPDPKATRKLAA